MSSQLLNGVEEPHLARVFGYDVVVDEQESSAAGYDGCWTTALLARDLTLPLSSASTVFALEEVTDIMQVQEINTLSPEYLSQVEMLGQPDIVDVCARDLNGKVVGKGQVVIGQADIGYVADMWTAPDARRRGVGRAVLSALHIAAQARGAKRAVLLPSMMAVETGFYAACGYEVSSPVAVLQSKKSGNDSSDVGM